MFFVDFVDGAVLEVGVAVVGSVEGIVMMIMFGFVSMCAVDEICYFFAFCFFGERSIVFLEDDFY